MSSISSNITSDTTRVKTGIKQHAKVEYCGARRKGYTYHWPGAEICVSPLYFLTFRVIPCWMKFFQSYLFTATCDIWIMIMLDKERSENECLHQHCGPRRSKLARDSFAIILSRIVALLSDCVARNLESFVVPLTMIRKIHKNNRNKTDTCWEGWGVGDTHFTGSHIGGIHISLGICVRGYTYHGDTHITVTPSLLKRWKNCGHYFWLILRPRNYQSHLTF